MTTIICLNCICNDPEHGVGTRTLLRGYPSRGGVFRLLISCLEAEILPIKDMYPRTKIHKNIVMGAKMRAL